MGLFVHVAGAKDELLRLGYRGVVESLAASPDSALRESARELLNNLHSLRGLASVDSG